MKPTTPRAYTRPRDLTPNIRRWMLNKGWIDHRMAVRVERPDPEHVARMYRLLEPAAVDVKV